MSKNPDETATIEDEANEGEEATPKLVSPPPDSTLLEPLLAVHTAHSAAWLADTASTAAERGLGALYGLLYLTDASGHLSGVRPASGERVRALTRLHQALGVELTTAKFDPDERPALAEALETGRAIAAPNLAAALPLSREAKSVRAAQRKLGIGDAWLAPLHWNGESAGVLLLLMPKGHKMPLALAELLGRHVAVALANLRDDEAGRKRGELDAVRWVYDERRFREELALEVRRGQRHHRPVSILLLRVQNVRELRARYGRFLSERLLRQVAGRLADAMRDTDFLGASGDDGFAAILVEAGHEGALKAEQRLAAGLRSIQLPNADLPDLQVQIACATATLPDDGESDEELIAAAESRLKPPDAAENVA